MIVFILIVISFFFLVAGIFMIISGIIAFIGRLFLPREKDDDFDEDKYERFGNTYYRKDRW